MIMQNKAATTLIAGLKEGLVKKALQSINDKNTDAIIAAGGSRTTGDNYARSRNINGPNPLNPFDLIGNLGQYGKTTNAIDQTRNKYTDYLKWRRQRQQAENQRIADENRQKYLQQKNLQPQGN